MTPETVATFAVVSFFAIVSPGPASLLAIRNGLAFGITSAIWSALGNVSGLFVLSAATNLGVGALLSSSALLFGLAKAVGAFYLFYLGLRHLAGRVSAISPHENGLAQLVVPAWHQLYRESILLAVTNPKPLLFFSALFPQFIRADQPKLPQFLVLTGVFMLLSFFTLLCFASAATPVRALLLRPRAAWLLNRSVGVIFILYSAAIVGLLPFFSGAVLVA